MMGKIIKDHLNFLISLPDVPKRVISLVPSQTEFLYDLGIENQILGITKYCVHPEHFLRTKVRVGGTKNFKIEAIKVLNPDLIIANKEENNQDLILKLKQHYPVWVSDIKTLEDAYKMMSDLGDIFDKSPLAQNIINTIQTEFSDIPRPRRKIRTAYLIWRKPYMSVNHDTFISHMLEISGLENVFAGEESRYPEVTIEQIAEKKPELVMLSSEPFPFSEKHLEELAAQLPESSLLLVDGEMYSWYGSRLIASAAYLKKIYKNVISTLE
jgi:ABC-type Fe3+-hydroxamate transport system substrate-binding protein